MLNINLMDLPLKSKNGQIQRKKLKIYGLLKVLKHYLYPKLEASI